MFSAPKFRWLLDRSRSADSDVCLGTVDSWLILRLTGGLSLTDAGNASRTCCTTFWTWTGLLNCATPFGVPRSVLPAVQPSNAGFGGDVRGSRTGRRDPDRRRTGRLARRDVRAGVHQAGMVKATYGTGSSVMTPVDGFVADGCTLAWLTDKPLYALEGNIVSSGAALAWTAGMLGLADVGALIELAERVPSAEGVVLVPAFAGLGAPHWDRNARAAITGMSRPTTRAHIARACVDAVAHQICDITDTIGTLTSLRADGRVRPSPTSSRKPRPTSSATRSRPPTSPRSPPWAPPDLPWTTLRRDHRLAAKRTYRAFEPLSTPQSWPTPSRMGLRGAIGPHPSVIPRTRPRGLLRCNSCR